MQLYRYAGLLPAMRCLLDALLFHLHQDRSPLAEHLIGTNRAAAEMTHHDMHLRLSRTIVSMIIHAMQLWTSLLGTEVSDIRQGPRHWNS